MNSIELNFFRKNMAKEMQDSESGSENLAMPSMLHALRADQARLKKIASMQRKIEVKRELLPNYEQYIDLVIDGAKDVGIITQIMIWAFDAGEPELFEKLALLSLARSLPMPPDFSRGLGAWLAESVAKRTMDCFLWIEVEANVWQFALEIERATADMDMHDEVRSKLHHACGRLHQLSQNFAQAIVFYESSLRYDSHSRVKNNLKFCKEKLAELNESQSPQGSPAVGEGDAKPNSASTNSAPPASETG